MQYFQNKNAMAFKIKDWSKDAILDHCQGSDDKNLENLPTLIHELNDVTMKIIYTVKHRLYGTHRD